MRDWIGEAWDKGIEQGREEGKAEGRVEGKAEGKAEGIRILIAACRDLGESFDKTAQRLRESFLLTDAEVEKDMKLYW